MTTLAWHETLELHELVASTTFYLVKFKMNVNKITDPGLRDIYRSSIVLLDHNLRELIQFMSNINVGTREHEFTATEMYAEDILSASKISIKMYAHAITETATDELRQIFVKQLISVIDWHTQIFNYLHSQGQYSPYNINEMLANDVKKAVDVLNMPY